MKTFFGSDQLDLSFPKKTVVAIGNFDGLHLGHQSLLNHARQVAIRLQVPLVVYTFNPHPTMELRPQTPLKLLMTYDEKRLQLGRLGIDFCVEEKFSAEFASLSAFDFYSKILRSRLGAQAIIIGQDFSFGFRREGSVSALKEYAAKDQVEVHAVAPVMFEGEIVSSSRIRHCLAHGQLPRARELLGSPFFYRGLIVHGDKRGRLIGFPTANMDCEEKFPLQNGVYATSVIWREKEYKSVTNIGTRPTFQGAQLNEASSRIPIKIETHILGQNFDLYGETLEVYFHLRLRPEKKFSSVDELKAQIANDVKLVESLS